MVIIFFFPKANADSMNAVDLYNGCKDYFDWVNSEYNVPVDDRMLFNMGKCKGVIELYNIDNKRATQVLKSVYQSFLTGYNLSYYEKTGKFKNLDLKSEYIFNAIMNDCRKNKNAYLSNILTDFWGNLDWGKR